MFLILTPESNNFGLWRALEKRNIEFKSGSVGDGFAPLFYFDGEGDWGHTRIYYGLSDSFISPELLEKHENKLIEANISIINHDKNGLHIFNLANPYLEKCNISFEMFSFLSYIKVDYSNLLDEENKEKIDLLKNKILSLSNENVKCEFRSEYDMVYRTMSHYLHIEIQAKLLNKEITTIWTDKHLNTINKSILQMIEIFDKHNVRSTSNIACCYEDRSQSVSKLGTVINKITSRHLDKVGSNITFSDRLINLEGDNFPSFKLIFTKDCDKAGVLGNNTFYRYTEKGFPYPQHYSELPVVNNIHKKTGSLAMFPSNERVFSSEQPWLERLFVPLFSIDMGCYKPEWNGLYFPVVTPIMGEYGLKNSNNGYFDENFLAFRLDAENRIKLMCEKHEYISDKEELLEEKVTFKNKQLEEYNQAKLNFSKNNVLGTDYYRKDRTIIDFGGAIWTDNWYKVPENFSLFNDVDEKIHFIDKEGNPVYYIGVIDMLSWVSSGAASLIFYEPKNRIILYTFNWS